jgi:hypothetical protein
MAVEVIGQLPIKFLEEPKQPGQRDVYYPTDASQRDALGQQLSDQLLLF